MNIEQIREMLQMQDRLNAQINPSWKTAKNPWTKAIWIEAAELAEHVGWKWWKAQVPNMLQAQIEAVDIWHFMLSDYMAKYPNVELDALAHRVHYLLTDRGKRVFHFRGRIMSTDEMSLPELTDLLVLQAADGVSSIPALAALADRLGLTHADLRRMYVGKNVLDLFRQDNGYKAGTYTKVWGGDEDNVHLERVLDANPDISSKSLYVELGKLYTTYTQGAQA
jgi:dimeric dUTPase (all-alpha-NTP-PPase superfamily)